MRTTTYGVLGTCTFVSLLIACQPMEEEVMPAAEAIQQEAPSLEFIPGQYIITFADDEPASRQTPATFNSREDKARYAEEQVSRISARVRELSGETGIPEEAVTQVYAMAVSGFAARLTAQQLASLKKRPELTIEQDYMVYLVNHEVRAVDAPQAVNAAQQVSCSVDNVRGPADGSSDRNWIWIVDTGIDLDHPDLNVISKRKYAKSFVGGSADDCHGHGTHVAGIAAAKDNEFGAVGVSAGAAVVPVRVFACSGGTPVSVVISGIDHVARYDRPGDVMNLSLGGYFGKGCSNSSSYKKAVERVAGRGTWVAIAAGNESDNTNVYQPACLNGKKILVVASMECDKSWSYYSNYGSSVDWIATGSDVYSTYKDGSYATLSGTSMATPHVAGIVHHRERSPAKCGSVTYNGKTYRMACL